MVCIKLTYAYFYYLDKETIAQDNDFDLVGKETANRRKIKNPRMNTQSFAITCWTSVSSKNIT